MSVISSPLITVVIPTYNRADTIGVTIDSVLAQSYVHFEIIIVDDFSSDFNALQKLIESYNKDNITLLRHTENKHGSAARNTGIKAARGQYIALLDSDDIWHQDKLMSCVEQNATDHEVLYSKLKNKDGVFPQRAMDSTEEVSDYLFLNHGSMQTSTLFLSKDLAQTVLFDESLKRFQDYDFVVRLQAHGATFRYIDSVLVEMLDYQDGARISNGVNCEPAIFWLNKVVDQISVNAARAFYFKRVIRLLVLSGRQAESLELMPKKIRESLSTQQILKVRLISIVPNCAYSLIRKVWKLVKRI